MGCHEPHLRSEKHKPFIEGDSQRFTLLPEIFIAIINELIPYMDERNDSENGNGQDGANNKKGKNATRDLGPKGLDFQFHYIILK